MAISSDEDELTKKVRKDISKSEQKDLRRRDPLLLAKVGTEGPSPMSFRMDEFIDNRELECESTD